MRRDLAEDITKRIRLCIGELNDILIFVRNNCSEGEFKAFRRGVGNVLSEIQDRLTDPIYREHPDVIPSDANYTPLPGPTLKDIAAKSRS
ncbi:uncharacterized protein SOCEGT47_014040 [Sorangium cellulosum]|uniref:Uncharacterized protein n=1 Tax=Sorangium cellulosum TaxID=56 RepID=A0A4P2PVZ0_SORCE|nr:hypothetical protein [Sorangium cellulosum]AUX20927.1 uncharacterized protein SOCEGT47_014040 [Sorangium cellulosum]